MNNKYGYQVVRGDVIVCPNPDCREYALIVSLHDHRPIGNSWEDLEAKQVWRLRPESIAKPYPDYIPAPIRQDYIEACLIVDKSPKASATLARRCLQGMIRHFWGITMARLIDEIEGIKDKVDGDTWEAIDSLRRIGNIGAHMEKDINVIVDVDTGEAELLIKLIETLFDEWYITRHERQQRMGKIKTLAGNKDQKKKIPRPPGAQDGSSAGPQSPR
jgi:hypothetical protein